MYLKELIGGGLNADQPSEKYLNSKKVADSYYIFYYSETSGVLLRDTPISINY